MPKSSFHGRHARAAPSSPRSVVIVGGGFTGTLFALKLASRQPEWSILLVEENKRLGRGLAYGACTAEHVLNVPVSRMEVGLTPSFSDWLSSRQGECIEALVESKGQLADAFAPRELFGKYLEERISSAQSFGSVAIQHVQARAVGLSLPQRRLILADGRTIPVDFMVLATGNLASSFPTKTRPSKRVIVDPWTTAALAEIATDAPLLLVGSGLTMVDVVLALRAGGHRGPIDVISRHGFLPRVHESGGGWPAFMNVRATPVEALRSIRAAVRGANSNGVPWQRVFDAVRPSVALLWDGWSLGQRAQFLRHLRTIWDVHRHRMAGRIARDIRDLIEGGVLQVRAASLLTLDEHKNGVTAVLCAKGEGLVSLEVAAAINCTGPETDLRKAFSPLLRQLLADGLIRSDPLGLGLESEGCSVRDAKGELSDWLFALGPLTRPSWWEITAVPEINAQVVGLVETLTLHEHALTPRALPEAFLDLGAGI